MLDRDFEIEELLEKIKYLKSLGISQREVYRHCKVYENCSKKVIQEKIREVFSKKKNNGKFIR